ncbi:acyltransferase family protein [Paenarthrobacter sp. NPDC056912]|uniref:acyltransferase family protein n=1 Tax=Paenarthrobacter sp. NPDC056912 TaxID=3345965 RepID=UPI003671D606
MTIRSRGEAPLTHDRAWASGVQETLIAGAPAEEKPPPTAFFPAIDGLRAVAVLSILIYHSNIYSNGIFGVDLFMAISGFLITHNLLAEFRRHGRISFRAFYRKRIKRLAPLLLITLCAAGIMVQLFGLASDARRFLEQSTATLLLVTNWEQIVRKEAYWDSFNGPGPLSHLWSLAVTEQFYLIWPPLLVVILFVLSRAGKQPSAVLIGVLLASASMGLVSAVWSLIAFDGDNVDRVYLGTDTHATALICGTLAAVLLHVKDSQERRSNWSAYCLNTGLGALFLGILVGMSVGATDYQSEWLYSGGFIAAAIMGTGFILTLTRPSFLTELFSFPVLTSLGKASYALFLVHMPIYWLVIQLQPTISDGQVLAVGGGISLILGLVLHHAVGEPLRRKPWRASLRTRFGGGNRRKDSPFRSVRVSLFLIFIGVAMGLGTVVAASWPTNIPATEARTRVLTLGDSLGRDFALAMNKVPGAEVTDGSLGGCGIASPELTRTDLMGEMAVPNGCLPWQQRWAESIQAANPNVILIDLAWDGTEYRSNGEWTDLCAPNSGSRYREALAEAGNILTTFAPTATVYWTNSRVDTPVNTAAQARCHNEFIAEVVRAKPHFRLLDLNGQFCPDGRCRQRTVDGNQPMYLDGVHFTKAGVMELSGWLAEQVRAKAQ